MGKSKHKARRRKAVDEGEERRKMRESILKIFRDRAQSSQGAVVVNDSIDMASRYNLRNDTRSTHHKPILMEDGSFSSDSQHDSQPVSLKRKRRKRIMTGQEHHHRSNKTTVSVSQHVKSAHFHSYKDSKKRIGRSQCKKQNSEVHITYNRLTRGIGLFNPGKKSRTIYRELPPVPETVQRDVEKTLKQILSKGDEDDHWSHHHFDCDTMDAADTDRADCHSRASTVTPRSNSQDQASKGCVQGSCSSKNRTSTDDASCESFIEVDKPFPKTVPYKEIAEDMLDFLAAGSKKMFKDRDLLAETCGELRKLLRQNQCMSDTVSSGEQPSKQKSSSSVCIKQSLLNSSMIKRGTRNTADCQPLSGRAERPKCHGYLSVPQVSHRLSKSHQHDHPSVSQPGSLPTVSRSACQPSEFGGRSQSALPSRKNGHVTDLSVFSLPFSVDSRLPLKSFSIKTSHPSPHHLVCGGDGGRDSRFLQSSHVYNSFNASSKLRVPQDRLDVENTSETFGSGTKISVEQGVRKDEGMVCDLDQLEDRSHGFTPNDSAIRLLQCNNFISRVSTLCGEADASPENGALEISLSNWHSTLPSTTCPMQKASHQTTDSKTPSSDCVDRKRKQDTFLSQVMDQSSLIKHYHIDRFDDQSQRIQYAEARDKLLGENYHRSHWSISDLMLGVSEKDCDSMQYGGVHSAPEDLGRETMSSCPRHLDLLDHLDNSRHNLQQHFWGSNRLCRMDRHNDSFLQDQDDFNCSWNQSAHILPPLRKPSLNSPSPPQKLSPHKWC